MPTTDAVIRTAKPGEKPYKIADSNGLFLLVQPSGAKWWRLKFRFQSKEKLLSLGIYPDVSLKEAREKRDDARKLLSNGVDPSQNRKAVKAARVDLEENSFEVVAREWLIKEAFSLSPSHHACVVRRLEKEVFPWLGMRPVVAVTPAEVLPILKRITDRGVVELGHRVLGYISHVFRYAVLTGRVGSDPTRDLRGALPTKSPKHRSAIVEPGRFADLLRAIDCYPGGPVVFSALKLAPLLVVRPGELRQMEWKDVSLETAEWRFLVTKTETQHIVPLCRQAVEILRDLHPLTGAGRYVFPNLRTPDGSRPMTEAAVLVALRNLGFSKEEATGHGFRASFRTIGDEVLNFRPDFLECQLAHAVKDANGRAYNRTSYLKERTAMMQAWADYLDKLRHSMRQTCAINEHDRSGLKKSGAEVGGE